VTLKPGYELQVAVPTKSESTARRVVSGWIGLGRVGLGWVGE